MKRIIWILFFFFLISSCLNSSHIEGNAMIAVDQVGYLINSKKQAFLVNYRNKSLKDFYIIDENGNKVFYGKIEERTKKGILSGDSVYTIDFSELKNFGKYRIVIGDLKSKEFYISNDVYDEPLKKLLVFYYLQRCGEKVRYEKFEHEICHKQDEKASYYGSSLTKDVSGGWHDAGNYEKYTNNTAFTVLHLLMTYEFFHVDISFLPEKKTDLPDILEEVKVGLDWLMKMQDEDGGVHHSVVVKNWDYWPCKPCKHVEDRYITSVTSFDTAYFVAALSLASRVFRKFNEDYSEELLEKAKKAWEWLEKHEDFVPEGGYEPLTETDAYEDKDDLTERLWAASELLKSTKEKKYQEYFEKNFEKFYEVRIPTWQDPNVLALISYYFSDGNVEIKEKIKEKLFSFLEERLSWINSKDNGYSVALKKDEFIWGSNALLGELSMLFILGYIIDNTKDEYLETAKEQIHYLFGRNALNISFVTGLGENSVRNPHHAPSIMDDLKEPWCGMVVGGPNSNLEDEYIREKIKYPIYPMKAYIDNEGTYSTNEPDISYNAPWVFVLSAFTNVK